MNDKNININFPGGGIFLLTITFVVLKALDYLDWSWWWVFSPLWICAGVLVAILLIVGIVALAIKWLDEPWWR